MIKLKNTNKKYFQILIYRIKQKNNLFLIEIIFIY